jgi:hypothetical protein
MFLLERHKGLDEGFPPSIDAGACEKESHNNSNGKYKLVLRGRHK